MIKFNLDKQVRLNFYDQIKGQLFSAIYCGKIKEGDRVPSIRELSDDLSVNYKTIRKIYLRLAKEKYLHIVQGSGAFLQKRNEPDTYEQMKRQAIYKLLGESCQKAKNLGLSMAKFTRLLGSYSSGNNLRKIQLAVVDHEEEAFIFSRELEQRLKVRVSAVSLDQIQGNGLQEVFEESDYLLTTSWHLEEVSRLAERYQKRVVEIKPIPKIYTDILSAAKHHNIAIVIQDKQTMHASWDIFMNLYRPSTPKKFWIASISQKDIVDKIIREADLIFVSPMCWDEMRKRTPAEKELKTYENFISEETISYLRELQLLG